MRSISLLAKKNNLENPPLVLLDCVQWTTKVNALEELISVETKHDPEKKR